MGFINRDKAKEMMDLAKKKAEEIVTEENINTLKKYGKAALEAGSDKLGEAAKKIGDTIKESKTEESESSIVEVEYPDTDYEQSEQIYDYQLEEEPVRYSYLEELKQKRAKKKAEKELKRQQQLKQARKALFGLAGLMVLLFIFIIFMGSRESKKESANVSRSSEQVSVQETEMNAVPIVEVSATPELITPAPTPIPTPAPIVPEGSTFEIYFIDVGEADAIVVQCDGQTMMIDGGSSGDSDLIFSFLKKHEISHLDYIVNTHPDEDHVGGLAGALNYANVDKAFALVAQHDTQPFENFIKYLDNQSVCLECPKKGDIFGLGCATVSVLAHDENNIYGDNTSLILRITYGKTSFLFMGDAETDEEAFLIQEYGNDLRSTLLKVGHHGSDTSSSEEFLSTVSAPFSVISVGGSNTYGHPTENVLNRLKTVRTNLYRTDIHGTIHCISDGSKLRFDVEKNADVDAFSYATGYDNALQREKEEEEKRIAEEAAAAEASRSAPVDNGTDYIGNYNSHKFHYPWCSSVKKMKESNKGYFHCTRDEMLSRGYSPCGNCHP